MALQKWIGGDHLSSLRALEPRLPLPRLINGCPAYINKRDRQLMRDGNPWIRRFWLTQFNIYRVLLGPMKSKVETIYSPFSGKMGTLLDLIGKVPVTKKIIWPSKITKGISLSSPISLVTSMKSSPSNSMSYQGLLTDWGLLTRGRPEKGYQGQSNIYHNIIDFIQIQKEAGLPMRRIEDLFNSLESLYNTVVQQNLKFPLKSSSPGDGLSQFAIKEEAAGKVRIFALLDSISQSVLRPLHLFLFDILKNIPNDGTFDQDSSVKRCSEKLDKYGIAYSFDLSAATDRLPSLLTAEIIESLVEIPGYGNKWRNLMIQREFGFANTQLMKNKYPHLLIDQNNKYVYSVGQPMGGLSSWAGLAITHHWILQYLNLQLGKPGWSEEYEILGDDIVIFSKDLAESYLELMNDLGVEINISKSINSSTQALEFAKRTIWEGLNVSAISLQQILSSRSLGARVVNSFGWAKAGLIKSISHLGMTLSSTNSVKSFRNLNDTGLAGLSFLNLLFTSELIELRVVLESLINPKYLDFDFEKAKFDLPLRSLLQYCLDVSSGKEPGYPFSKEEDRKEFYNEIEPHLSAVVLQEALHKAKLLAENMDDLVRKGSSTLVLSQSKKEKLPKLLDAQLQGFFLDNIISFKDIDPWDLVDKVEDKLYRHAKYPLFSVKESLAVLDEVEKYIFKFTFAVEKPSHVKMEKDSSPVLSLLRKSQGNILIPYWTISTL